MNLWSRPNLNPARPHFPTALQPGNGHLYFFTSIFSLCSQLNLLPRYIFFFFFVFKLYLIDRFNPGCPGPALSIIWKKTVPAEGRGAIKSPCLNVSVGFGDVPQEHFAIFFILFFFKEIFLNLNQFSQTNIPFWMNWLNFIECIYENIIN